MGASLKKRKNPDEIRDLIRCGCICLILLLLPVGLTACGEKEPQAQENGGYTFTDDLGREVTVSSTERVAVLLGSYADLWMLRKTLLRILTWPWRRIR